MVESYKYKSKIATAIGGIATVISIVGQDQLTAIFPQFGQYIPIIVALATWYISQTTENKRVEVAEELVRERYSGANEPTTPENLNEEYVVGEEDGC